MHKKAQPKNDKRNIESRSVKTSAFKDKYSWVGHFVKQKRPEKRPVTHSQTHCKQVGKRN